MRDAPPDSEPARAPTPTTTRPSRSDWALAALIATLATTLAFALRQTALWSDGRELIEGVEKGYWTSHYLLYFPAAHLVAGVTSRLGGLDTQASLCLLSALGLGVGAGLFFLFGRDRGLSRWLALLGTALFALSPVVVFFGTCVEAHALQLPVATAALLWASRAERRGTLGKDAALPSLLFLLLVATHPAGLIWVPLYLYILFRVTGHWSIPKHLIPTLVVFAAGAAFFFAASDRTGAGPRHALLALRKLLEPWRFELFVRELVAPAGVLYPLAAPGLVASLYFRRKSVEPRVSRLGYAALILCVSALPLAFTLHIFERGAYYISLVPVVAAVVCVTARRLPPAVVLAVGIPLVLVQLLLARAEVRGWEKDYPGADWIEAMFEECGERGLILSGDFSEYKVIRGHTWMTVGLVSLRQGNIEPDTLMALTLRGAQNAKRNGAPIVLTQSFLESKDPTVVRVLNELESRFGASVPARNPRYRFLLPPANVNGG